MSKVKAVVLVPLEHPESLDIMVLEGFKEPFDKKGNTIKYSVMSDVNPKWLVTLRDAIDKYINGEGHEVVNEFEDTGT